MIEAIYVLGIAAAILVNIAALTLLVLRYIPFPATARATGLLSICLALFSLEHFIGLGSLYPLTLSSIILPALVLGLAWEFLTLLRVRLGGKLLSIVALAIGGTGLSPLLHVIKSAPSADFLSYGSAVDALIFNSRFLGYFDSSLASGTWQSAFGEVPHSVRLPIETFGYQYAIGGYHAVLSGFLLQFLALTIMAAIPRSPKSVRFRLEFILGLTVPPRPFVPRLGVSAPGGARRCLDAVGPAQFGPMASDRSRRRRRPRRDSASALSRRPRSGKRSYADGARCRRGARANRPVPHRVVAIARARARGAARRPHPVPRRIPRRAVSRASDLRRILQRA
jgi:hypothetical protein